MSQAPYYITYIPYYDSGDGRLLNFVSAATAQQYLADGIARAVRRRTGQIVRLNRLPRERVYATEREGIGALHAASQTTQRIRDDGGVLIVRGIREIREHRVAQAEMGSPRLNVPLADLDIVLLQRRDETQAEAYEGAVTETRKASEAETILPSARFCIRRNPSLPWSAENGRPVF